MTLMSRRGRVHANVWRFHHLILCFFDTFRDKIFFLQELCACFDNSYWFSWSTSLSSPFAHFHKRCGLRALKQELEHCRTFVHVIRPKRDCGLWSEWAALAALRLPHWQPVDRLPKHPCPSVTTLWEEPSIYSNMLVWFMEQRCVHCWIIYLFMHVWLALAQSWNSQAVAVCLDK